jgi:uncharacterized protein (TIGR03435 family)
MARRWLLATSLVVLAAARSMPAQAPLAFDVASVKLSPYPNASEDLFTPPDGSVLITNYTLGGLITYAYGLKTRHELAGGPDWLLEQKFVISAAAPQGTTDAQLRLMVQELLADRFRLRLRKEEGALPVWTLVVDRADGSLGPQLTRSNYDCMPFFASGASATAPDAPRDEQGQPACTMTWSGGDNRITYTMTGATIDEFVRRIDAQRYTGLDRPIVNRTGLNGSYDLQVTFASPVLRSRNTPQTASPIDVAVREQLGLRLELRTAPGMRYVVESVERSIID